MPIVNPPIRLPPVPGLQVGMGLVLLAALLAALLATGCSSPPQRSGGSTAPTRPTSTTLPPAPADTSRDGPGANPPPDLHQVPDAMPQLEPVRSGGPNQPYEVLGQAYAPLAGDPPLLQRGLASWYGRKFHGRSTANGETYNMYAMTAAHRTMPLPSYARVRNPANGREVVLRVNDRGPFHSNRVIDLSYTAALKLGLLGGVGLVEIERITYEAIRTGAWRAPATPGAPGQPMLAPQTTALLLAGAANALADDPLDELAELAERRAGPAATKPTPAAAMPAETTAPAPAAARSARGFWLQLGAFSQRDGAMGFQQRVALEAAWLAPLMAIFSERNLHRLQAGPYASRADAHHAAERLRDALSLVPAVVERR